ncbi:hypothetical protein TBLA_0D02720 [Henningerozyma blattae CBS 6284]|uniref:ATP-dependent RNA helicase SUV3, mitochondrial n=1 Tax=Henningerozyma blattae (strain ATCC 34711 / CBS 6284 / DSM 70876 / NBRC 10599 / NRRL Y-10934 / UCD 77-7) TaxID=1071380 RepID=I2H323_HENB6|nr:hypothetical protein TBLA_0D02720 [Tetrapisispora blattae CBS 6284]CCH60775.1 hypothetical protein TBLA_0D02720 [Tetrapisispora blattae CBS 6284]
MQKILLPSCKLYYKFISKLSFKQYRCIHAKAIFENTNWIKNNIHLSKAVRSESGIKSKTIPITLNKKYLKPTSIYIKDQSFKELLDSGLSNIYNEHIVGCPKKEREFKNKAWGKLRSYLYNQLNVKTLNTPSEFVMDLFKVIDIKEPDTLLLQLLNMHKIEDNVWVNILGIDNKSITSNLKCQYILNGMYNFIYNQEIIPNCEPAIDTDIDISNPAEWFPEARKLKRTIVLHLGPTNSGKTYRALQTLKSSGNGYYAGPLRLLAREVYDRFKAEGFRCNLLTGEEVIQDLDKMGNPAGITSGTIEMVPLHRNFDIAVFDEIQMMADPDRGWAWTIALLGVQAREVHLCGEKSALPLLKELVKMTGDNLVINEYERLGKLTVEKNPLNNNFALLEKGDCIVAFSKKKILDLKLEIEKRTKLKVAVVYGSLPPETRIQQANLFNSGTYDVVVASDAIGMGLNLAIRRVVFTTNMKFNGKEMESLTSSNIKQIGGRAGRFKADCNKEDIRGYITATDRYVLASVNNGIEAPIEYLTACCIWPTDEICNNIMKQLPSGTLMSELFEKISILLDKKYNKFFKLSDLSNKLKVIKTMEKLNNISFSEKLRLCNAPMKDFPLTKDAFKLFCETISRGETKSILSYPLPFKILTYDKINDDKDKEYSLEQYEAMYSIFTLYSWLHNRYPNYFIDIESVNEMRLFCEMIIFAKLDNLKKNPYNKFMNFKKTLFNRRYFNNDDRNQYYIPNKDIKYRRFQRVKKISTK